MPMTTTAAVRKEARTLDAFEAAIDEHSGTRSMFAGTVRALAGVRDEMRAVQKRRDEVFEVLKGHFERGDIELSGGRGLAMTASSAPTMRLAVSSEKVKRQNPRLWERCKAPTPYTQVGVPTNWSPVKHRLPPVPDGRDADQSAAVYESMGPRLKELRESETALVDRLRKIGADNGWDGLPIQFADGWKVGLTRMQFSADRLAALDPMLYKALAEHNVSETKGHVYIRSSSSATDLDALGEGE